NETDQIPRRIASENGPLFLNPRPHPILGRPPIPTTARHLVFVGMKAGGSEGLAPARGKVFYGRAEYVVVMAFDVCGIERHPLGRQLLNPLDYLGPGPAANAGDFLVVQASFFNCRLPGAEQSPSSFVKSNGQLFAAKTITGPDAQPDLCNQSVASPVLT